MTNDARIAYMIRILMDRVALTPSEKAEFERHLRAIEPKPKSE
jgi:hypothetical protein